MTTDVLRTLSTALLALGIALCSSSAEAQASSSGGEALQKTLSTLSDRYGISTKDAVAFHLKAHFDTFDAKGKTDGSGTLEEYWDGKQRLRRELVYRGASETVWHTPAVHRKTNGTLHTSYFMRNLVGGFETAIPAPKALERVTFTDKQQTIGSVPMHCIVTRQELLPLNPQLSQNTAYGPIDEDAYCLSDADRFLRLRQSFPGTVLVYNKLRAFANRAVPYNVRLMQGAVLRGELQVDTLESANPDDVVFVPPSDAEENTVAGTTELRVNGGEVAGNVVSKRPPAYPLFAKNQHLQGSVVLGALITKEGTISELEVLASPAESLSEAAMEAVRSWKYKPFLLDGNPTEVDTTVTVNFTIGPI